MTARFFPDRRFADAGRFAEGYFEQLARAAATIDTEAVAAAGELLATACHDGKMVLSCGNGGSAAIANHLVCDCMKGVQAGTSLRPRVHSLSTTVELITAIGNDIGYDEIFAFQLNTMGRSGDVLVAISSSGSSLNVVKAIAIAREQGMHSIAMTGFDGGEAARTADVSIHVNAQNYGVVEDLHQSVMHVLAQHLRHAHIAPEQLGAQKF